MNLSNFSQPSLKGARVLPGHVLVHSKFHNSEIVQFIQESGVKPVVQEGLGIVDFYPSNRTAVIWISEEIIITKESSIERKLITFAKGFCNGIVFVQVTNVSHQYYKRLQLSTLNVCNITLVPVKSSKEMAKFLTHLVFNECNSSQKLKSLNGINLDEQVIGTLKVVPGVGEKKAKELLKSFTSLAEVCDASSEDMRSIVGYTVAQNLKSLFENCN